MKDGDVLADGDRVARYCKPTDVDQDSGMPNPQAFQRRESELHPSVNWLDWFGEPDPEQEIAKLRETYRNKSYRLGATGKLAVLAVATVRQAGHMALPRCELEVTYRPLCEDESHCEIEGYPDDDDDFEVALQLAAMIRPEDVFPTRADG